MLQLSCRRGLLPFLKGANQLILCVIVGGIQSSTNLTHNLRHRKMRPLPEKVHLWNDLMFNRFSLVK